MAKIRQKTVVEQVMEQIKELIASGTYQPGDKLPTEHELAERFGIGRSSVREAIKIFNYLGVLTSKAAKGTFLSDRANISAEALSWSILLGKDEQQELIETRGAIELWSIITLIRLQQKDEEKVNRVLEDLLKEVDKMKDGIESKKPEKLVEADYNFHNIIVKSTGNSLFYSIYKTLKSFMYEEIVQSQNDYSDQNMIVSEHQSIIDTIQSGQINSSVETFSSHIDNIESRLKIK
ncbi:FadR/GntR family transcriptional regulator [Oceanispirochaeta sp.]|jgi:GntR family transcriptional repressor for pyruvate dehydrogenase complex|uniref:FadR/GntR family transcriptional regulator n=1 Tax=Oceanispirochaeta sp. TaxID=2035350 RepID=UPI002620AF90|nr:FadR/GntR family transcriptional regulator [Oceanispirochaeta sp.]MDA3958588.1 FadR/GntR family transcriptional regulator [Oceanispirochaeta sp.]